MVGGIFKKLHLKDEHSTTAPENGTDKKGAEQENKIEKEAESNQEEIAEIKVAEEQIKEKVPEMIVDKVMVEDQVEEKIEDKVEKKIKQEQVIGDIGEKAIDDLASRDAKDSGTFLTRSMEGLERNPASNSLETPQIISVTSPSESIIPMDRSLLDDSDWLKLSSSFERPTSALTPDQSTSTLSAKGALRDSDSLGKPPLPLSAKLPLPDPSQPSSSSSSSSHVKLQKKEGVSNILSQLEATNRRLEERKKRAAQSLKKTESNASTVASSAEAQGDNDSGKDLAASLLDSLSKW